MGGLRKILKPQRRMLISRREHKATQTHFSSIFSIKENYPIPARMNVAGKELKPKMNEELEGAWLLKMSLPSVKCLP